MCRIILPITPLHVQLDYLLFQILALIFMKDILRYPNERNDPIVEADSFGVLNPIEQKLG